MNSPSPVPSTLETATKADVAKVESKIDLWVAKQESWVKNNWPHVVTWLGVVAAFLKHV